MSTFDKSVLEKAAEIVKDCQGEFPSYCTARCPMHTDAMAYVNLVGEGKNKEAIAKIREKLFLPGTLGRICAHPCEDVCRREKDFKQPIAIAALKRYAADKADDEKAWDLSKKPASGKKIAVVGAGPAGAQAAIDLAKEGHAVTVFEKLDVVGGMMRVGIPAYRLPRKVIDFEYSYLNKLGITFKMGVEIGKDIAFADLKRDFDAVVVANGAHKGFVPPVSGADCEGVTNAVDFLKSASLNPAGTSVGKRVVVVGGGDVAMDCARTSLRVGAEQVTLISLEAEGSLPASHHEQVGAKEEDVLFRCAWGLDSVASADGKIASLSVKDCLSLTDAEGNFNPSYGIKREEIPCDTLIFATGQQVTDVTSGALAQGRGGRYVVDKETLATDLPGVFVAGDSAGGTIVVEAMALGRKAAISVGRFLAGQDLKAGRDFKQEYHFLSDLDIPLPEGAVDLPRRESRMVPAKERIANFDECDLGFDDAVAREEGSRCLKCECKLCMKECIMLNDFTTFPGELLDKFIKTGEIDPLAVYSCNMCDQCTLVCPKDFKFAYLFAGMRKDLVKANGGESPMKGHKAIKMHQLLGFSKFFTTTRKGGKK